MWTRSAKDKATGLFTVTCTDWNGVEVYRDTFSCVHEAERAGNEAERRMAMKMMMPADALTMEELMMSDDELLAALGE